MVIKVKTCKYCLQSLLLRRGEGRGSHLAVVYTRLMPYSVSYISMFDWKNDLHRHVLHARHGFLFSYLFIFDFNA